MQQLVLDLSLPAANRSPDDLVLGNCNFSLYQWLQRWPDWPMSVMALYGPAGSGKSHFARLWQQKAQAQFWTIQQFEEQSWNDFLFDGETVCFCLEGIPLREKNFLHFFNALQQRKGFLLLIDRLPPAHWNIQLPDLKSRLNALPALGIEQPDEEFMYTFLTKLLSDHQLKLSKEIIDFTIPRLPRSFEAIQFFVSQVYHLQCPSTFSVIKGILNTIEQKQEI